MPRSKSSNRWLQEHFNDVYVKKAHAEGYRSRAVYKLKEVDEKEHLLKPGQIIVDLGAAPGGWSQYATQKMQGQGRIIALDLLPMDVLEHVDFIQGDFRDNEVLEALNHLISGQKVDLVLSDMAPNMSGNPAVDIPRAMLLTELALDFSQSVLKTRGTLFMKVFHGEGFDDLVKTVRQQFQKVVIRKPLASRGRSRETYLLAKGYNL
ncbi:MAG: 23S rRNA (uridine(2552)-2'-O)-methyltransferase RlmE [Silvanigrellaceae bacterium]|nr:23S rRNA (uridine(2552)-2'-O)-methyltransferase RlmE [Silvanigrellaceae bacterium]